MPNVIISPDMNMPVPVVGFDPGPDWANNVNACLSIIDGHNHTPGSGVQITPTAININTDLPFNSNNATAVRSVRFTPQSAPLSQPTDLGCVYESGVDLYYNDGNGNPIRMTQSGSLAGAAGTITGLPSGTASASYSAGTFTFQQATNTPAAMRVGPISIGNGTLNSKTVTIFPNNAIASNYNISLPAALPATLNYVTLDNSGNLSYNAAGITGSGAVVLNTGATLDTTTFTTSVTGVIDGQFYSPTIQFSLAVTIGSVTGTYIRINGIVMVSVSFTCFNGTGLTANLQYITLPIVSGSAFTPSGTLTSVPNASSVATSYLVQRNSSTSVSPYPGSLSIGIGANLVFTLNISYNL